MAPWLKYLPPTINNSQSPSPPAPTTDPDAPLNLTKPKSESFSSSSSANSTPRWNESLSNSIDAAKTLLPSSLMMGRSFLPYPTLHHPPSRTFNPQQQPTIRDEIKDESDFPGLYQSMFPAKCTVLILVVNRS